MFFAMTSVRGTAGLVCSLETQPSGSQAKQQLVGRPGRLFFGKQLAESRHHLRRNWPRGLVAQAPDDNLVETRVDEWEFEDLHKMKYRRDDVSGAGHLPFSRSLDHRGCRRFT